MATIEMDSSFSQLERTILRKTFRSNCKELGIDNDDFRVQLWKRDLGPVECVACVNHPVPDFFHAQMNSNKFNMFDATASLSHETVHMKQYLRKELVDIPPLYTMWKGKAYQIDDHPMDDPSYYFELPWEKEAFGKQVHLQRMALRSFTPEERRYCHYKHSNGLVDLWRYEEILAKRAA